MSPYNDPFPRVGDIVAVARHKVLLAEGSANQGEGVFTFTATFYGCDRPPLLVGVGSTPAESVAHLYRRVGDMAVQAPPLPRRET